MSRTAQRLGLWVCGTHPPQAVDRLGDAVRGALPMAATSTAVTPRGGCKRV
jgi:hypothetical protein